MTDETNIKPPETPPITPPVPEPPKPSKDVQDAAHKNAEYFARNQEVLGATLELLEKAGVVHVNQRIDQLQRELTVRDAIADNGLTKADAVFISGNTPEQINASATAFKARLDAVVPKTEPGANGKPAPKPAATPAPEVPPLPDHRGNRTPLEAAEANLLESAKEWTSGFSTEKLGHLG